MHFPDDQTDAQAESPTSGIDKSDIFLNLFGQSPLLALSSISPELVVNSFKKPGNELMAIKQSYKQAPDNVANGDHVSKVTSLESHDHRIPPIEVLDSSIGDLSNFDDDIQAAVNKLRDIQVGTNCVQVANILLSIQLSSFDNPVVCSVAMKQLAKYSLEEYAEEHFLIDRKVSKGAANRLLSYRLEPWHSPPCLHSALLKASGDAVSKEASSLCGDLEACLKLTKEFISDRKTKSSGYELVSKLLQQILSTVQRLSSSSSSSPSSLSQSVSFHSSKLQSILSGQQPTRTTIFNVTIQLNNLFIDEVYCQLCGLIRGNPSPKSAEMCWQMLLTCLAVFPPSKRLLPSLLHFILVELSDQVGPESRSKNKSFLSRSLTATLRSAAATVRHFIPSAPEVQAILLGEDCDVDVRTMDYVSQSYRVDSFTTIAQLESMILSSHGINFAGDNQAQEFQKMFAVFEVLDTEDLSLGLKSLDASDRVLDVIAGWVTVADAAKKALLFKVKYFFPLEDLLAMRADEQSVQSIIHLLYLQAVHDVSHGVYPCSIQDAVFLAAIRLVADDRLQRSENKPKQSAMKNNDLKVIDLKQLICADFFPSGNITPATTYIFEHKILTLFKKISIIKAIEPMDMYLKYVRSWSLYGGTFFRVSSGAITAAVDIPMVLSVSVKSLTIVDATTAAYIAEYAYDELVIWGYSFDSFMLTTVVSSVANEIPLKLKKVFRTARGEEIDRLLKVYSNYRLRRTFAI